MKSKIKYSRFATILTMLLFGLLFAGCIAEINEKPAFFILLAIYVILVVCAFLYAPFYVKADEDHIVLGSLLRTKKMLVSDIDSVELFQPTMGAIRIFGSGGFMGYWGLYKEGDIGRYYAFYGRSSDCFLIRMKNGDKYVVGCERLDQMVTYIKSRLK